MATKTNAPEPTIIDNVEALQARMKARHRKFLLLTHRNR